LNSGNEGPDSPDRKPSSLPASKGVESNADSHMRKTTGKTEPMKKVAVHHEPRGFMYSHFLHHPGLVNIQYKTFFHMCRLEGISFDMESKSGSTFCLFDCL